MSDPSDAPVCRWRWREVDAAPCSCGGVTARLGELILGWLRALIARRSHEDPASPAPPPGTATPPLWYLECFVEPKRRLRRFPIDPLSFRVGRSPSLALVLLPKSVSRAHAELFVGDGKLHVRDLGSKNGTFVNRERVQEAPLQEGDIIRFADREFYLGRHDTDHGSADWQVPRSLLAKVRSAPRADTERQPPPPHAGPRLMPAALPGRAVNLVCSECNQLFRMVTGFGALGRLLCASCAPKLLTELKHRSLQLLPLGTPTDDPTAPTDDPTLRSADPTVTNDSLTVATQSPGFSPEERELLVRLSGLFVKVNRSFGAVVDRLTGEQREGIEAAFERARRALREGILSLLRSCVEEMQRARRLLEELSEPSQSSATRRAGASERRPGPSESSTDTPWSASAVELYRDLIRARLSEGSCTACGVSLAAALLVRTSTSVGPELNELGLSDEGAARYLAATDDLVVQCGQCGAQNVVPSQRTEGD